MHSFIVCFYHYVFKSACVSSYLCDNFLTTDSRSMKVTNSAYRNFSKHISLSLCILLSGRWLLLYNVYLGGRVFYGTAASIR